MAVRTNIIKELEEQYSQEKNKLVVFYGSEGSCKFDLIKEFVGDKKFFYYRARQASELEQRTLMGNEIAKKYRVKLTKGTYDEYFTRIKSGDASKLVVVIDEFQYIAKKKDSKILDSIIKLKNRKLYPGPVMIILCCSSILWAEQDMEECFGETNYKKIDKIIKVDNLEFLDIVRMFPKYSVKECIQYYGILGGVYKYTKLWNQELSVKQNICNLVLDKKGELFTEVEKLISYELRELSVYNTIVYHIANGKNKLNDIYIATSYSRPKISVYMKNLSQFDILEKVVSFETGGWQNAKKGVYRIKDTFINFWYKFVFPHMSDLYIMEPDVFYDTYIEPELDEYLERYFRNVCMEYLKLLDQIGKLPFKIHKIGTWVGKTGTIDIIAQSSNRVNIVGMCNWNKEFITTEMVQNLFVLMEKAKIYSEHVYCFSAKGFSKQLIELSEQDGRIILIDMNEL
ncbi:MAG: ATP-binding protein [Lachnobacterium sp.]|nr:ATP-binding protein [Lachnobacterium sp.]